MAVMASRASNFCIDSVDPYAQVRWWSLVLDDFQLLDEAEMGPDEEECWLVGPDDREIIFTRVPEPKTVKNRGDAGPDEHRGSLATHGSLRADPAPLEVIGAQREPLRGPAHFPDVGPGL